MQSKHPKHEDLIRLYEQAETVDNGLFAEQRSNLQLVSGEHYNQKTSRRLAYIRESRNIPSDQKLRLTKNHIQKITTTYVNSIVASAPSVVAVPNNEKEFQDMKAAELNNSVMQYAKARHKFSDKLIRYAEDFVEVGEVFVKIMWDNSLGDLVSQEPMLDEAGEPMMNENGEPKMRNIMSGDFSIQRIYGFNVLRDPRAKDMETTPVIIRSMMNTEDLKRRVGPEKEHLVSDSEDKTYKVFDAATNEYAETKDQTLLMEFYYPKSEEYPNGYYFYATVAGILWEGEIPFGIWPIVYCGFNTIATSPRHRSLIKHLRPYQIEINRAGSKIAEHQISIGDDKLIITGGAKVSSSVETPGIRTVRVSGGTADYLPGRTGEQYTAYMNANITEMYQVANLSEEMANKEPTGDILLNLFKNMKQKKKFAIYVDKFEHFLVQFWETFLALAKEYYTEDMIIPMIGKNEAVNISEFKNSSKLCYSIRVEPQIEDVETQMGRQVIFNHILQYVGNQLDKKSIGQLIRQMPFGNWKAGFSELTRDEDMANNMILALDRGQVPIPNPYDDHRYMISRLVDRVRQSDFDQLDPLIQKNYNTMIRHYQGLEKDQQMEIMEAEKGFIPSGGARVKADYYVTSPNNPNKTERATIPAESIEWLLKRLADQGSSQEALRQMNQGAVAEIAAQLNQQEAAQIQGPEAMPPSPMEGM